MFYCTTDQVRVLSIFVNFCRSYAPFWTLNTRNTQFSTLFSYTLWHIELKFCIWLCLTVLQIKFECCQFPSIFVGVIPLLELKILEINTQFSALSSYMLWHIKLKFCIWLCFTVLQIKFLASIYVNFDGVIPLWNLQYWKYTVFRTFLLHALTYWAEIFHMSLFYCTTD